MGRSVVSAAMPLYLRRSSASPARSDEIGEAMPPWCIEMTVFNQPATAGGTDKKKSLEAQPLANQVESRAGKASLFVRACGKPQNHFVSTKWHHSFRPTSEHGASPKTRLLTQTVLTLSPAALAAIKDPSPIRPSR